MRGAVEPDRDMAALRERLEVAPRAAAEIENRERRRAFDVAQQRRDVLADVVVARAMPEFLRMPVVVRERAAGDVVEVARTQWHCTSL